MGVYYPFTDPDAFVSEPTGVSTLFTGSYNQNEAANFVNGLTITGISTFTGNVNVDGAIVATGNVTAFSDINLKKDIEVIPNALDKALQIRGLTFNRTDIECDRQSGVIAQEVEEVLPEVVTTNEKGIKSVAYGNMVGLLIEAIKDLKEEVETLKDEIKSLKQESN